MAKKPDVNQRIVTTAMGIIAREGWRGLSMTALSREAGLSLADLHLHLPGKGALFGLLARQVDGAVLAGGAADPDEPPRDRLFDVLMRRFDALSPHKPALKALWREAPTDPLLALGIGRSVNRSMGWMLEAAGITATGLSGMLQARGLAAVWVATLKVWLEDDSPDLSRTMAALDANLRRAGELWASLNRPFRPRPASPVERTGD